MPDLGPYALPVIGAYLFTIAAIGVFVLLSVLQARRVREELGEIEREKR